jgi:hypothetical protein
MLACSVPARLLDHCSRYSRLLVIALLRRLSIWGPSRIVLGGMLACSVAARDTRDTRVRSLRALRVLACARCPSPRPTPTRGLAGEGFSTSLYFSLSRQFVSSRIYTLVTSIYLPSLGSWFP